MATRKRASSPKPAEDLHEPSANNGAEPDVPARPTQAPPLQEKLALPKGALIALRKSGGGATARREVIVYPGGRVTYDVHQKPDQRRPRKLSDAKMAELAHLLERTGFFRMSPVAGETGGDAATYEIAAHLGTRANTVECPAESVPEALVPLVDRLTPLLPAE